MVLYHIAEDAPSLRFMPYNELHTDNIFLSYDVTFKSFLYKNFPMILLIYAIHKSPFFFKFLQKNYKCIEGYIFVNEERLM